MNNRIKVMRDDKVSSALLKFGIPSIIGFLVTAVYNFVDAIFVGKLGTCAMGATSVAFPITLIMIGIGLLLGSGAATKISIYIGKDEFNKANKTASTALFGSLVLGVIVIMLILAFFTPTLKFLGATQSIMPYAKAYGYTFVIGSIFSIINIVLNHIARAEGAAKLSMNILLLGAALNIILDPFLIYTFDFGIKGAAIATLISQLVSTIFLLKYFFSKSSLINFSINDIDLSKSTLGETIKIGIPYCVAQLLAGVSMGLINSAATPYGDAAVAAVGIANRIFAIGIYAMIGFSKGFQPIAGYNYGAKKYDRLNNTVTLALKWSTYFCIALAIVQIIFANPLVSLFTNDTKVLKIGISTLKAYSFVLPFFGFQIIYMTLFLTLGKAKEGFVLSLGRQGMFLIPAIIILPKLFGLNGVIYAQPIADILTVLLTFLYSYRINKMRQSAVKV